MKKKFYFFDSDALKNFHKRVFFSITIFCIVYIIAFYRIIDVTLLEKPIKNDTQIDPIYERGNIYDRNGNLLSSTIQSFALSVNPKKIKDKNKLAEKLYPIIGISKKEILKLFNINNNFVWIKRNISPQEHQAIINLGEVVLQTKHKADEEIRRIYPYGSTGSHIIGFTSISKAENQKIEILKGESGIERGLNDILEKGHNVNLSIDINLQQAVRNELNKMISKFSADSGFSIIMDVTNGEIISMNSLPDFDPNNRKTFKNENMFNRPLEGNYEMGSVIKPITVAMAIDKEIISPETSFDVSKSISGIEDFEPYNGSYNVKEIIVNSSNRGTAQIAKKVGKENQREFFNKIGFNKKIDLEIIETANPLGNKNNWGKHETMRIGYGYAYSITPLHLTSAYASLVNGGKKINPTLLTNENREIADNINIIKTETSSYFNKLLRAVILETKITGKKVNINGYEIGGKTGTANLLDKYGKYQKGKNLTSFIAVFPISKPKYVVLASIENPKKSEEMNYRLTGATVAAPLVKNIILKMIEILNISPPNLEEILKADISSIYINKNNATF